MTATDDERYRRALHGMQSAIEFRSSAPDPRLHLDLVTPKHVRVGIDSAHVSNAALVRLLINKGVLTLDEYQAALADAAEAEVASTRPSLPRSTALSPESPESPPS